MSAINEFEVRDTYDIGFIRRLINDLMRELGFSDREQAEVSIVVSELCSNMIKHDVTAGKIRFFQIADEGRMGIEIVAEDKGPGIENIEDVLRDGVSTKGTMGGGLGAVRRLSDSFKIISNSSRIEAGAGPVGTTVTVRKWSKTSIDYQGNDKGEVKVSVLSRPHTGFAVNGDSYYIKSLYDREVIAVTDGLGHGQEAFEASSQAVKSLDENTHLSIEEMMSNMNTALKYTRGAVAALVILYKYMREFEIVTIGNIDCRHISGKTTQRLFSHNGFMGSYQGSFKAKRYSYHKGDKLVLCTDGISTKWDIENYTDAICSNPPVLLNALMRDFSRPNDDATILVAVL